MFKALIKVGFILQRSLWVPL